ncbi:MAG TPA: hypothetical protein V6D03_01090 [Candidatus Caenarcaniphilales bacterium]
MQSWFWWNYFLTLSSILLGVGASCLAAEAKSAPLSRGETGLLGARTQKHPYFTLAVRPACPTDIETLTTDLVRDLPIYANRAFQQNRGFNHYLIVAGRPEFEPLPLGPGQRAAVLETSETRSDPYQVFITTLERTYQDGRAVNLQLYHWLFLTQTNSGWRLAMMFSIIGPYPAESPPLPPQDSSEGSLAQAIRTWLRDCR